MFQGLLSVIVCIPSIGKHQNEVHGFLFFKEIFSWTYNQGIDDYK